MSKNLKPAQMKFSTIFDTPSVSSPESVIIVDSLMGSGKTSWAIQYMNSLDNNYKNFIYVTIFLSEIDRIKQATHRRRMYDPVNKGRGKLPSLKELLKNKECIATTHELFKSFDQECRELISEGNYTLILDETLDTINQLDTRKNDYSMLTTKGCITPHEDGSVTWNKERDTEDTLYNDIKDLAENGSLAHCSGKLFWRYPPDIFHLFQNVYILTYGFKGSTMRYYFNIYHIPYKLMSIKSYNNTYALSQYEKPDLSEIKEKIDIYDGKLIDNLPQNEFDFSSAWFNHDYNKEYISQLKKNIYNYFRNVCGAKSDEIMWTTFLKGKDKLKGKGYTKQFVSCNARSSNEYADKQYLAYALNLFMNPNICQFYSCYGHPIDENRYATLELVQWIWRSRIRNNGNISIYIPSFRMRNLLTEWLFG